VAFVGNNSQVKREVRIQIGTAVAFWTAVAALYVAQTWWLTVQLGRRAQGVGYTPATMAYSSLVYLSWIPLTVLVWRATRPWTIDRFGWRGVLLRHVGLYLACAATHNAFTAVASSLLFNNPPEETFLAMFMSSMRSRSYTELIIYGGVVAAGQAWAMYDRWHERDAQAARLEAEAAKLEAQLAAAQLNALEAQLQPHFLFNSLHTVASLARDGRNADVVQLVADLSELLRQVTDQQAPTRPLGEELALASRYLAIQQVRFGDRLRVDVVVPDALLSFAVPALTLQPLVDNAVRHGLTPQVTGGTVRITAERHADGVRLSVADDGAGVTDAWSAADATGTGLRNLRARLAILYGTRASLAAGARDGGGFLAVVTLPGSGGRV
jgi:signal transduction histidine kinase